MSFDGWSMLGDEILAVVHDHVLSDLDNEVGGFLLGMPGDRNAPPTIVAAIEAHAAQGDLTSLTFTHEAWHDVLIAQEENYPDSVIVGWYHSHPGHGIFLSEYDKFIHRSFFTQPWQIAIVVDPVHRSEGIFVWRRGDIELLSERDLGDDVVAGREGATAFTMRDDVADSKARERIVVTLDDIDEREVTSASGPLVVPVTEEIAVMRAVPPVVQLTDPIETAAPPPAQPTTSETYPIAGLILPALVGGSLGVLAGVAAAAFT